MLQLIAKRPRSQGGVHIFSRNLAPKGTGGGKFSNDILKNPRASDYNQAETMWKDIEKIGQTILIHWR